MNPADILAPLVCLVAFGLWALTVSRIWHNEWKWASDPDRPPGGWPWGAAIWRGFARVLPISGAVMGLLGVAFLCLRFGGAGVVGDIGLALACMAMLVMVVGVGIVLFNRPRRLVAPHLRHHPGAILEWAGRPVDRTEPPQHRPLRQAR